MKAQGKKGDCKYQQDMRNWLGLAGLKPTELGVEDARKHRASYKREIVRAIENMDPRDLSIIWMIVHYLTCWKYS